MFIFSPSIPEYSNAYYETKRMPAHSNMDAVTMIAACEAAWRAYIDGSFLVNLEAAKDSLSSPFAPP